MPAKEHPTIEVRIFRDGTLLESRLVETEREAAEVVELWNEVDGVTCVVGDLIPNGDDPQLPAPAEDEYPAD